MSNITQISKHVFLNNINQPIKDNKTIKKIKKTHELLKKEIRYLQ